MAEALCGSSIFNVIASQYQKREENQKEYERRLHEAQALELSLAVQDDLLFIWGRRILEAIQKEQTWVTNRWSFRGDWNVSRNSEAYMAELSKLLGPEFKVTREFNWRGSSSFVKVSWGR
jgi:hypothetical protein